MALKPRMHLLTFAESIAGRLARVQHTLDRLTELLPRHQMDKQASRVFTDLLGDVMYLVMDAYDAKPELVATLETRFPECVERRRALNEVGEAAYEFEDEMEGCPHRCALMRVEQVEDGYAVAAYEKIPRCLAEGLDRRYPGHFRITAPTTLPKP